MSNLWSIKWSSVFGYQKKTLKAQASSIVMKLLFRLQTVTYSSFSEVLKKYG